MAEPTLEQMLQAAEGRQALPQAGMWDTIMRMLFQQKPNSTQMPRYDENGQPLPAQTLPGLIRK